MPLDEFKQQVSDFIAFIKTSPSAEGSQGIFYPGEIEHLTERQRRRDGIEVDDETWSSVTGLAKEHGLERALDGA